MKSSIWQYMFLALVFSSVNMWWQFPARFSVKTCADFDLYYFCSSIFLGKTAFYFTNCIVLALLSASCLHRIAFDSLQLCLCVCVVVVMNDIITTMFNKKFLEELFKPQELYSKKALRTVFDRLAHASIMRLNQASMDKVKTKTKVKDTLSFSWIFW